MKSSKVSLRGRSGSGPLRAGKKSPEAMLTISESERKIWADRKDRLSRRVAARLLAGKLSAEDARNVGEALGLLAYDAPSNPNAKLEPYTPPAPRESLVQASSREASGEGATEFYNGVKASSGKTFTDNGGPNQPRRRTKVASTRNWRDFANTLRGGHRGEWTLVPVTAAEQSLSKLACSIRTGATGTWAPRGAFEARIVGHTLEARYVGVGYAEPSQPRGRDREGRFLPDREAS